jgi:hypothetical protein
MKKQNIGFILSLAFAMAFGITLGMSPLATFAEESMEFKSLDVAYCQHNVIGDNGIANFCAGTRCAMHTGQGSVVGPCGTSGGPQH